MLADRSTQVQTLRDLHAAARAATVDLGVEPARSTAAARGTEADVVQRLAASITVKGGKITSARMRGSAPATNLRGKRGDHTTAYVTFEQMAINTVVGATLDEAIANLAETVRQILKLPGYVNAGAQQKKPLTTYANNLLNYAATYPDSKEEAVRELMVGVVSLRNGIPMTAFFNKPSTGGHGEAGHAGGLHALEKSVRDGKITARAAVLKQGDPTVNVWGAFDFGAARKHNLSRDQWASVFKQHMLSMQESYPFLLNGLFTYDDMKERLVDDELPGTGLFDDDDIDDIKTSL